MDFARWSRCVAFLAVSGGACWLPACASVHDDLSRAEDNALDPDAQMVDRERPDAGAVALPGSAPQGAADAAAPGNETGAEGDASVREARDAGDSQGGEDYAGARDGGTSDGGVSDAGVVDGGGGMDGLGADDASGEPVSTEPPGVDSDDKAGELPCDVAAVFETHCHGCHGAVPSFGAPMPLLSWSDLQAPAPSAPSQAVHALLVGRITSATRPMPPLPNPGLSGPEISVVEAWLASGQPKRGADETCEAPTGPADGEGSDDGGVPMEPVAPVVDPDAPPADCAAFHELRAHGSPVAGDTSPFALPARLDAKSGNLYQCFYFDLPYEGQVQGLWFAPLIDDARVVHHWNLWANDGRGGPIGEEGEMSACDAGHAGSYMVAGWAPGGETANYPMEMGLQMPSGNSARLLLEVHYFNGANLTDVVDRSGVRFCTAPDGTRPESAAIHQLGTEGICLPPGQRTTVTATCNPRDDMGDIHVTSVFPHMHRLGVHQSVEVLRADGTREVLHDAPFAFDAQVSYPVGDVVLRPGDRVETRCTYENTTDARVPFGEQTQEEMCYAYLTAWPAGALSSTGAFGAVSNLNRCVNNLSVLASCNGLADAP